MAGGIQPKLRESVPPVEVTAVSVAGVIPTAGRQLEGERMSKKTTTKKNAAKTTKTAKAAKHAKAKSTKKR
jgi:hypothetical protein